LEKGIVAKNVCINIMIVIYNKKLNVNIIIPKDTISIIVLPKMYEDVPSFRIEFKFGFNLGFHSMSCRDCGLFLKSLGNATNNWFLEYDGIKYAIDTFSSEGLSEPFLYKYSIDPFINGSILQFKIIPLDFKTLKENELLAAINENYDSACRFRDLINNS